MPRSQTDHALPRHATITEWWWVRHAPVHSAGGRIYGQRDLPADCTNLEAFRRLTTHLPSQALWVVTPLQRTRQTFDAVHAARGTSPVPAHVVEPDLAEQSLGDWEGRTAAEFFAARTGPRHPFWFCPADERPPGGESVLELVARVGAAVDRLSAAYAGRTIVAIAHGGTIRAALAHALGLAADVALGFRIDNLSVTRLAHVTGLDRRGDGPAVAWRIGGVNQVA